MIAWRREMPSHADALGRSSNLGVHTERRSTSVPRRVRPAVRLSRRVRDARLRGPLRPRLVTWTPPTIAMERVGSGLSWRPRRTLLLAAFALACLAHAAFATWSLGLRPHKAKAQAVEMIVQAPVVEEPLPEPEPELEPETTTARKVPNSTPTTQTAPVSHADARSALPGPLLPLGLGAGLGDGLGGGMGSGWGGGAAGGGAPQEGARGTSASATTSEHKPHIIPPRALRRPPPDYPRRARAERLEGYVALQLLVAADGTVQDVRIIDSDPKGVFDDAAVAAVRRWTFAPGRTDGTSTEQWVRQTLRFSLSDG